MRRDVGGYGKRETFNRDKAWNDGRLLSKRDEIVKRSPKREKYWAG